MEERRGYMFEEGVGITDTYRYRICGHINILIFTFRFTSILHSYIVMTQMLRGQIFGPRVLRLKVAVSVFLGYCCGLRLHVSK